MISTGERIHLRRKELNLTMEEVGSKCGVKASAVNKWEKGIVTNIPLVSLQNIANALECSVSYLIGAMDTPNEKPSSVVDYLTYNSDFPAELISIVLECHSMDQNQLNQLLDYARFLKEKEGRR